MRIMWQADSHSSGSGTATYGNGTNNFDEILIRNVCTVIPVAVPTSRTAAINSAAIRKNKPGFLFANAYTVAGQGLSGSYEFSTWGE